ncbi:MAG: hypothetical protein ACREDF_01455, partial [Thermoplasmata archaeon]
GSYTTVTQINSVSAVGSERNLIDVSAHGDMWADFLGGRQEGNEVELTLMWDPTVTQHTNIKNDYDATNQVARYYELQHPNWASAYRFASIVSAWEVEATDDAAMEAHATLKIVNPGVSTVTPS